MSLRRFLSKVVGNANERELGQMQPLADAVNDLEDKYEAVSESELRAQSDQFRRRLKAGETLDDLLVEAYAAVREASKRTTGKRHFDVQILGGIALHRGYALEMKTGEGKTLVATLPLFLNALTGKGVHLVTVNDYLARRDVQWMGPIYDLLGLSVGLLQQGQEHSFLFDPTNSRSTDDYRLLKAVQRRQAYAADITYGTNSEFGFDYLRDNSVYRIQDRVQRGFCYALVDEVDNILIDEARTPLIISGPATEPTDEYYILARVVKQLSPEDYEIDVRTRSITLTDPGYDHVEQLLGQSLFDPEHPEEITPQQAKLLHHLEQALKAEYTMHRDRDYIIQGQRVVIVDEFTGRTMPGRRWSDGLHQAVEAKENVQVRQENVTYATITLQNYFRMYEKLAGMTGTAATEAEEFEKIYKLNVLVLPTNRPIAREDRPDVVLRTEEGKFRAVVEDIIKQHCLGRPTLVGTTSVEVSERLSARLDGAMVRRWAGVALLRSHLNSREVDNATYRSMIGGLNEPLTELSASQVRKQGDELGISIDPNLPENLSRLANLLGLPEAEPLKQALQRGVPHSVLNARHHTEEARIVACAGEVGAVTIATNMAGRGVDIKLGGELDEETLAQVNRVLRQNGVSPFGLEFTEMARELERINPERYYLYRDAVDAFLKHVADEERVKALGGLHVIGTERHEARRIDNQLRGRSGRQGDPGSSTFYLSLEDDLMRRFGGSRVSDLAARLANQDEVPISLGIVSRAIANAQTQVEGYNFDIRKHLIDYDDVLNTQRNVIYEQRKRILTKPDLREDVWAMVESELAEHIDPLYAQADASASDWGGELAETERVSAALRLVHYLETVQPVTAVSEGALFPSFALQYVLSTLPLDNTPEALRAALRETLKEILASVQRAGQQNIERIVLRSLETESASIERFMDAATLAYEGAELEAEETGQELDARSAAQAVTQATGFELDTRSLQDLGGRQLERALMDLVRAQAQMQVRLRLLAQVQARLNVSWKAPASLLTLDASTTEDAQALLGTILDGVTQALAPQQASLLGEIETDINARIRSPQDCTRTSVTNFLHEVRFGARSGYDKQHRRVSTKVERVQYTPWVAEQIAGWDRERLERAVLDHLQAALQAWESAWADLELRRIGSNTLAELDQETQSGLAEVLGAERLAELQTTRVLEIKDPDRQALRDYLGTRVLFNVQRQLMLDTTSRYWVEHLTAIEVLRQGVGLQSYAQKDPLAEYRVRAYEMFQDLLRAIQADVVTGMFTYRPRDLSQVRVGVERRKRPSLRADATASQDQQRRRRPKGQKPRKRRKRR